MDLASTYHDDIRRTGVELLLRPQPDLGGHTVTEDRSMWYKGYRIIPLPTAIDGDVRYSVTCDIERHEHGQVVRKLV